MVTETVTTGSPFEDAVAALTSRIRGEVIRPDAGYNPAEHVWNAATAQRPALVIRAADEIDVINAVNFAREHDLVIAGRSGGHSIAGHSSARGSVVIDLSLLKAIRIDPERRVARVQAGVTSGEYAAAAHEYGLATTTGDAGTVGLGGLTLGGGIGWFVRKHGLAIDHLLSAEMVTADGRLVRANEKENADLFWALRGGGGNFGIVTSFEFRLHEAGTVIGGAVLYPAADAATVLPAAVEYARSAPEELTTIIFVMRAPPAPFIPEEKVGMPAILIAVVYSGDLAEGERVVAPLRTLGTPIADIIGPMPYPAVFALAEAHTLRGMHHDVRSGFLDEADDEFLATVVSWAQRMPSPLSGAQLRILGGQMARVDPEATAFAHRDKGFMFSVLSTWLDPADAGVNRAVGNAFWEAVRPWTSGVYANFLSNEGEERVREAYPERTHARLAEIKRRYDPENLFRLNQNIKPA